MISRYHEIDAWVDAFVSETSFLVALNLIAKTRNNRIFSVCFGSSLMSISLPFWNYAKNHDNKFLQWVWLHKPFLKKLAYLKMSVEYMLGGMCQLEGSQKLLIRSALGWAQ